MTKLFKRKALSPLIATILLIVVAVAIIGIIVSWGKGFTTDNLTKSEKIKVYSESDVSFYINILSSMNGRTVIDYKPPANSSFRDLNIIGYGIVGLTTHVVPFDSFIQVSPNHSANIDHGVILPEIDLLLYLDNDTVITKKKIRQEIRQPSSCPQGYTPVPGNHLYGTMNKDGGFCVAKWEMKVDQDGDGIGDTNATCKDVSYNVWDYRKAGCSVDNINNKLVSSSQGYPLTWITSEQSNYICEDIGGNLITNDEWMTIARNIELVPENWTGREIGSGSLYIGNNSGTCEVLCACYNSSLDPDYGLEEDRNTLARLKLTNDQYIWDLSGNIWEWTYNFIDTNSDSPYRFFDSGDLVTDTTHRFYDYFSNGGTGYYISYLELGNFSLGYKDLFLFTSGNYNSNQGIGRIHLRGSYYSERSFLRGGSWSHGKDVGVLALSLFYDDVGVGPHLGFRCVK